MKSYQNSVLIEIGDVENSCFVVMPFDSLFQTQYERVIRPVIEELGLKCIRGDEIYSKPQIMADIWSSLRKSRLVIAELTGRNPNVFYEIGLAHALGKPIILLTRNQEDVPFDLKSLRYWYYDVNDPFWGDNLREVVKTAIQNILEQSDLPSYLEGIKADFKVPAPPKKGSVKRRAAIPPKDISGNWKASWKRASGTIEHQGTLYITQQEEKLSATMTVTFEKEQEMTIVQEVLVGMIQGAQVSLGGVSYTYIKQGASTSYLLDSFKLKLSSDKNSMHGEFNSKRGAGEATFVKLGNAH